MEISGYNLKGFTFLLLIALFVWSCDFGYCNGRDETVVSGFELKRRARGYGGFHLGRHRARKMSGSFMGEKGRILATSKNNSSTFNVLDYGAKGDGKADDTKAFQSAWEAACNVEASTVIVPSGSVFLVKPISFSISDCKPNIIFQLDGKIIAPTSSDAWGKGLLEWIEFKYLKGFTLKGSGTIDGQGSVWWDNSIKSDESTNDSSEELKATSKGDLPSTKPTALRFYGSDSVTVTGITIQNSPQTHLKFDACTTVRVFEISISSPRDSPNTDGIHLQNSKDVVIYNCNLACGDDCVSIQAGCSNINIHDINCGPGHGISIGSLGKDETKACVSNVTIRDVKIQNTLTGVRIKTWQGGSGSVKHIMFSNIQVTDVKTPIMIDQYYCDKSKCPNQTSAIAVSGINYVNIRGTYTTKPVHLGCSDSIPCTDVSFDTVRLTASQESSNPFCWKAFGELKTPTTPPIDCLQSGKPSKDNKNDSC